MPGAPNAAGHFSRRLGQLRLTEAVELRDALEQLAADPTFTKLRSLLIGAHDEIVESLGHGPYEQAFYAQQHGLSAGLGGVEDLIKSIRAAGARAEDHLLSESRQGTPHLRRVA